MASQHSLRLHDHWASLDRYGLTEMRSFLLTDFVQRLGSALERESLQLAH